MRHIHLDDGLRLRFPGRSEEFDQGVEIGMLAMLMSHGTREFSRRISRDNLEQVRAIALQLGYRVIGATEGGGEQVDVIFRQNHAAPHLELVHSVG